MKKYFEILFSISLELKGNVNFNVSYAFFLKDIDGEGWKEKLGFLWFPMKRYG